MLITMSNKSADKPGLIRFFIIFSSHGTVFVTIPIGVKPTARAPKMNTQVPPRR
jgi:hypothetical protein